MSSGTSHDAFGMHNFIQSLVSLNIIVGDNLEKVGQYIDRSCQLNI